MSFDELVCWVLDFVILVGAWYIYARWKMRKRK
jgi:hypothetical protein